MFQSGTDWSAVRIKMSSIYVNNCLTGCVVGGKFERVQSFGGARNVDPVSVTGSTPTTKHSPGSPSALLSAADICYWNSCSLINKLSSFHIVKFLQ